MGNEVTQLSDVFDETIEQKHFSFDNLTDCLISPGDIYLRRKGLKSLKLIRAGGIIQKNFLEKYEKFSDRIYIEECVNLKSDDFVEKHFNLLRDAITYKDKFKIRNILLSWFKEAYWEGALRSSLLDLIRIGEQNFLILKESEIEHLLEQGQENFLKLNLWASLNVFLALSLGYLDFNFLRDLYQLTLLFDCNLFGHYSWGILEALKLESANTGEGLKYLSKLGLTEEAKLLNVRPEEVFNDIKINYGKYFYNPNLLMFIKIHHEKNDGSGFPYGLLEEEFSELESLIIFGQQVSSTNLEHLKPDDGMSFLKNSISKLQNNENSLPKRFTNFLVSELDKIERVNRFKDSLI